jgi:hypothetical protein
MIPHQEHMHLSPPQTTGPAVLSIFGFVGAQGAVTAGTHGIGVKTPAAAAVAAATDGFDGALHIPNGAMLTIGIQSVTVAIGRPHAIISPFGTTVRGVGIVPNEHMQIAPLTASGTM